MLSVITIQTPVGESLVDITAQVRDVTQSSGIRDGLCAVLVPHTTAAITVNSAMDPATMIDIIMDIRRIVPMRVDFAHQYDTPADAAGHVKAALIGHSIVLVVADRKLLLGGSQSILLYEFDGPRERRVQVKILAG
jgi:secondary thiamine-phosphate synthase enzyme